MESADTLDLKLATSPIVHPRWKDHVTFETKLKGLVVHYYIPTTEWSKFFQSDPEMNWTKAMQRFGKEIGVPIHQGRWDEDGNRAEMIHMSPTLYAWIDL